MFAATPFSLGKFEHPRQVLKQRIPSQSGERLWGIRVGLTGIEPATFRPPAGRATKLRHSPRHESASYLMGTNQLS